MKKIDMLHGSIADKTFFFAITLAVTGMAQQMFNVADTLLMGRFTGSGAMAAVGSSAPLIGLIYALFIGISLGTNVVSAQLIGKGDRKGAGRTAWSSLLSALGAGIVFALLCEAVLPLMVRMMDVPEEITAMASLYLRIYFLSLPGFFLFNFTAAIFRSHGNTRTPFICLFLAGLVKAAVSFVMVVYMDAGVAGAAFSSLFSAYISAGLLLYCLFSDRKSFYMERRPAFDFSLMKRILIIGVPAGLQGAVFSISNVVIQTAINGIGTEAMAATAITFHMEILGYYIFNAFGQAATTFVGQNYGRGLLRRCRRIGLITLGESLLLSGAAIGVMLYFGRDILTFFNPEEGVVAYGLIRLKYGLGGEMLNVIIEMISGYLRGFGRSMAPAAVTLTGICGVRLFYVHFFFPFHQDFATLMKVYPLSWLITALCMAVLLLCFMRRTGASLAKTETCMAG
ncbi:MATE family efflux transporter [Dialister sp.]|uniref:MATE family efflux transporter n=1 Tax=Dialister sp. TaxID=1955814 RepID=UPI003EFDEF43